MPKSLLPQYLKELEPPTREATGVVKKRQPSAEHLGKAFPLDSYDVFTNSKEVILYSLLPSPGLIEGMGQFHDYSVLGSTNVRDVILKERLKSFLVQAICGPREEILGSSSSHGLRLLLDENVVDVVLSFQKGRMVTYYGEATGEAGVIATPARLYNRVLRNAGVPIYDSGGIIYSSGSIY